MELNIKDRLYFAQILPSSNSFLDYATKKSIVGKIAISEEEKADYEIIENPSEGKITWNVEKDIANPLNVEFSAQELDYLKRGCEALSDSARTDDFWVTVEKIYNAAIA